MNPIPVIPFIATADADFAHSHSFMDALPHLAGMLMVLITLACLWALTAIVANLIKIYQKIRPAAASAPAVAPITPSAPPAPAEPADTAAPAHAGISPEIVAVISAAIACLGGGKRRVISIRPADTSWEKAGRQAVIMSHRIR